MDAARIERFFLDYGQRMDEGVRTGQPDTAALAASFASHYVASSPAGVVGGEVTDAFGTVVADGIAHYRRIGATGFSVANVVVTEIDALHAMARVAWRFDYRRPRDGATGSIAFENVYFVTLVGGAPRIFAWITPDEQAALEAHGLV